MKYIKQFALISTLLITYLNAETITNSSNIEKQTDPQTGLIIDTGYELVKRNCTVCHSSKFILLQRGTKKDWESMIVWMQETQGLWEFDPDTQNSILEYLSKNYAPEDKIERRKNLSPSQRPANPYAVINKIEQVQ